MAEIMRHGLFAKQYLRAHEVAELEQLAALCAAREQLHFQLDYNLLSLPTLPTDDLFFYYQADQLAGCLLMDRYHSDMKEVTCMVHPAFRRRGIFRELLTAARQECLSRGITRLLFICENTSNSGQAVLQTIGAGREFAEHHMILQAFQPRGQHDNRLVVHEARFDDRAKLVEVLASDFEGDHERAFQHILRAFERPNQRFYLATYGGEDLGSGEPVAILRVEDLPREIGLFGFLVRPEYRGRGHGRQLMEEVIMRIHERSQLPITLEVDTNNFTAFNLYRSLGFVVAHTYVYYGLELR